MTLCKVKNMFVGMILISIVTVVSPGYSQTTSHPKWKYPMISKPDSGTILNKDRAEKIMKIANYVVDHHQVFIDDDAAENEGKPFQFFRTKFSIDSATYSIMVSNPQTEEYNSGFIDIEICSPMSDGFELRIFIIDQNFDGLFNFGVKTVGAYDVFGKKNLAYDQSVVFNNYGEEQEGLEYQPYFQTIGDNALEHILSYIEMK